MRRELMGAVLVVCAASMTGCQMAKAQVDSLRISWGQKSAPEKVEFALDRVDNGIDGLYFIQSWLGVDILTEDEHARFDGGFLKTRQGLSEIAGVLEDVVARLKADDPESSAGAIRKLEQVHANLRDLEAGAPGLQRYARRL